MYMMIHRCEDGPTISFFDTKEKLLAHLHEMEEETPRGQGSYRFVKADDFDIDKLQFDYFPEWCAIIIKGEIVQPQPVKVVESFDIP